MEHELYHRVLQKAALNLQAITTNTTTVGAIIDTAGFESMTYIIQAKTITDGVYDIKLEEGDDSGLSDVAVVPTDQVLDALPQFVAADDNAVKRVGVIGKKRYQRLSVVSTGVTTGVDSIGAVAVMGHAKVMPTAVS